MYIANMTKRGSLITAERGKLATRNRISSIDVIAALGYPSDLLKKYPIFPSTSAEFTINNIGYKFYVDHSAPDGGDGLSWATAYNNLNSALSDPFLFYTCTCQRQVVHLYIRGVIDYPIYVRVNSSSFESIFFYNYLVIHNGVFEFHTDKMTFSGSAYSGIWCINVCGVVFKDCSFTLIQQDGKSASTYGEVGHAPEIKYINSYGEESTTDNVRIFAGNYIYLKSCSIHLKQGSGGNGYEGKPNTDSYNDRCGSAGGNSGRIGIFIDNRRTILDTCAISIESGNPGSGGRGAPAYKNEYGFNKPAGNGGNTGVAERVRIDAFKIYNCEINHMYAPTHKGGDGGDTGELTGIDAGTGGSAYTSGNLYIRTNWCNKCVFNIVEDYSNVSAGNGGYAPSYEYDWGDQGYVTWHNSNMGAAGSVVAYGASDLSFGTLANSSISLKILHNGAGNWVQCVEMGFAITDCANTAIVLENKGEYTPIKQVSKDAACFAYDLPEVYLACDRCTNVDVVINLPNDITLPDGGDMYFERTYRDGRKEQAFTRGGASTRNGDSRWGLIDFDYYSAFKFPSSYCPEGEYGMRVTISSPPTITAGYPAGSAEGWGMRGIGRDGHPNASGNSMEARGGNGTPSFTYYGTQFEAGSAGKGTNGASDGSLIPSDPYVIDYYTGDKDIEITFI